MKCLMVAFAFALPYHVLRTAAAAGNSVHVLGNGPSRALRWSRHCCSYRETRFDWRGEAGDLLQDDIAETVREHGIDLILPSDDVSTRLLATLRDRLPAPTSLIPDVATFDLLNDKWNFTRLCLDTGVRVPQGWLYQDVEELRAALDAGTLHLPITAKPTSCSAGVGVVHLREPGDLALLNAIDYRPILVQRHIRGETIGISVVCRDGEILAHATQRRDERRFELFANPDLLCNVKRLVAATGFNGPANFDAVLEERTGLSYIVECNPRFWYTIYMSMILGVNFVDLAMRNCPSPVDPTGHVQLSLGDILRRPGRATRFDWEMLRYHFSDPFPFVFQRRRLFGDHHVHLPPEQTRAGEPREAAPVARRANASAGFRGDVPPDDPCGDDRGIRPVLRLRPALMPALTVERTGIWEPDLRALARR